MSSQELDFVVLACAVEHDLGRAKFAAAMNERDFGGEAGEEQRLFHGGVAAANDRNLLAREEEPVAGSARRNTVADERLLVRQTKPTRGRAAGDDQARGSEQTLPAQIDLDRLGAAAFEFFWLRSTLTTWPVWYSAPKRAACLRMFSMSSGP